MNKLEMYSNSVAVLEIKPPEGASLQDGDVVFYRNSDYRLVKTLDVRGVRIIRNPLASLVSGYYSHLESHKLGKWKRMIAQRKALQNMSRDDGMWKTLEFMEDPNFAPYSVGPLLGLSLWDDGDKHFLTLRMEDMVLKPIEFLETAIRYHGKSPGDYRLPLAEKFTFKAMTGRKVGEEDTAHHLRSGNPNDWQDKLPEDLIAHVKIKYRTILKKYYPGALE